MNMATPICEYGHTPVQRWPKPYTNVAFSRDPYVNMAFSQDPCAKCGPPPYVNITFSWDPLCELGLQPGPLTHIRPAAGTPCGYGLQPGPLNLNIACHRDPLYETATGTLV